MGFELPELEYAYDALEPHIDAETMELHHSKHHAGYTANLNAAIDGTDMGDMSIEELMVNKFDNAAVRNNGGVSGTIAYSGLQCHQTVAGNPVVLLGVQSMTCLDHLII